MSLLHCLTLLWFIGIKKPCIVETLEDHFGHVLVAGQSYIIANFLEKKQEVTQKAIILKKTVKLPTFIMKVLCTSLCNSQKEIHLKFGLF